MARQLIRAARQHLRILGRYMIIGIVRKSQFRVEFWSQVAMDLLWYATHVAVFEVLFLHTESIAGWGRSDVRVMLGFLFVSDAFMMAFLGANWRFSRDLKDGKLDPFRVRPGSGAFLYFFQFYSLEGTVNGLVALSYLLLATHWAVSLTSATTWLLLAWGLGLTLWARTITLVAYSIVEFYALNSELSQLFDQIFDAVSERPLDILGKRARAVLIWVLPIGLLTYVPAALVLGKLSPVAGLTASASLLGFTLVVRWAWNRGFRRYTSAMG